MPATAAVVSIKTHDPIEHALRSFSFGKRDLQLPKNHVVCYQGEPADALYSIQQGKVKLVVVSFAGKEATLAVLGKGEFFGLGSLQERAVRLSNATTLEPKNSVSLTTENDS